MRATPQQVESWLRAQGWKTTGAWLLYSIREDRYTELAWIWHPPGQRACRHNPVDGYPVYRPEVSLVRMDPESEYRRLLNRLGDHLGVAPGRIEREMLGM